MRQVSKQLNTDLDKVDSNINQLQTRLKPVTQMNETVGLCKRNITESFDKIKGTCDALAQAEEASKALRKKDIISREPALFAHWMKTGQQILDTRALDGYKDRDLAIGDLRSALNDASANLLPHLQGDLHKIADGSDVRSIKLFTVFLRAVERSMSTERFKVEVVDKYQKSRLDYLAKKIEKITQKPVVDSDNGHPLLAEMNSLSKLIENEYTVAHQLFFQQPAVTSTQSESQFVTKFDHIVIFWKISEKYNLLLTSKLIDFGHQYLNIDLIALNDKKIVISTDSFTLKQR